MSALKYSNWLARYAVVALAALVVCWPLFSDSGANTRTLASYVLVTLLLASLVHLGESQRRFRWWWFGITVALSFGAPLAGALAMSTAGNWWIGAGVLFTAISGLIVWRAAREETRGR